MKTRVILECYTPAQTQFTEIQEWIFPRTEILKEKKKKTFGMRKLLHPLILK